MDEEEEEAATTKMTTTKMTTTTTTTTLSPPPRPTNSSDCHDEGFATTSHAGNDDGPDEGPRTRTATRSSSSTVGGGVARAAGGDRDRGGSLLGSVLAGGAPHHPNSATTAAVADSSSSQQSNASQPEILTQNPDLTQPFLGDFLLGDEEDEDDGDDLSDDEDAEDAEEDGCSDEGGDDGNDGGLRSARRRRRRRRGGIRKKSPPPPPMPWGRLVPCGGTGASDPPTPPIDLMPRPPIVADRIHHHLAATTIPMMVPPNGGGDDDHDSAHAVRPRPGDVFNEYVVGRSAKCDVVVRRRILSVAGGGGNDMKRTTSTSNGDDKLGEWVYSLVSNKHVRLYCLQHDPSAGTVPVNMCRPYEVYVEDTSNNGTVVNGTVLRRCEKRILNSGDEVCLVNPHLVRKKVRSTTLLQHIAQQYSYVFVAQQPQQLPCMGEAFASGTRGTTTVAASATSGPFHAVVPDRPTPLFSDLKPAVDPRAMKSHSFVPPAPRHPQQQQQQQQQQPPQFGGMSASQERRVPPACLPWFDSQHPPPPPPSQNLRRISPRRQPTRRVEEDYDIRDLLGSGTTGEVRRAIERRTGIQRAVKIIPIRQTLGNNRADATAAVLTAEANLLRQLDHPYVVKLVDVYASPSAVCLVMELLHGGELFDRIVQKGRYSEDDARRVMRRILSAMHYLHEDRHVVHRDLKPENILLRSRESDIDIMITDFGLAKAVAGGDGLKTFCGTATYCAPEILQRRNTFMGRGRYNKQADQWSLGVILYILLSGCQPFDGDQWMASGSNTPPPSSQSSDGLIAFPEEFWTGVSDLARDMVRRMLVVDPKKRITVREACNHPWILMDDGDTHRHPLDDPRFPRESLKPALQKDAVGGGEREVSSLLDSSTWHGKLSAVQETSGAKILEVEPKPLVDDRAPVPDSESIQPQTAEQLGTALNNELSDDEIFSQFSDKTDSVSTFDTCDASPRRNTTNRKNPVVHSADKENDSAPTETTRKRRVTTSVSSSKSLNDRLATPSRRNASQTKKKVRKSDPSEPSRAQTQKQTKLSAWFKQK